MRKKDNPYKELSDWLYANQGDITEEEIEEARQNYGIDKYDLMLTPSGTIIINVGYTLKKESNYIYRRNEGEALTYEKDLRMESIYDYDIGKDSEELFRTGRYELYRPEEEYNPHISEDFPVKTDYTDIPYQYYSYSIHFENEKVKLASNLLQKDEVTLTIIPFRDKETGQDKDNGKIYVQIGDNRPTQRADCEIYTTMKAIRNIPIAKSRFTFSNKDEVKYADLRPKKTKEIEDNDLILYQTVYVDRGDYSENISKPIGEARTLKVKNQTLHPKQLNKENLKRAIQKGRYDLVKVIINKMDIRSLIITTDTLPNEKIIKELEASNIIFKKKSENTPQKKSPEERFTLSKMIEAKTIYKQLREREREIKQTITRPRKRI